MTEGTYLDSILSYHRDRAENDLRSLDQLLKEISTKENNRPSFQEKIVAEKGLSVIAEIKRRSPSKGELKSNLDAVDLAQAYERAGAACVSVLTDYKYFGGSREALSLIHI